MSDETQVVTENQEETTDAVDETTENAVESGEESTNGEVEETKEVTPKKSEKVNVTLLDPTTVHIDDEFNGRHFAPDPSEVNSMVKSLKEKGQLQPVRVRKSTTAEKKLSGKDWKLLFGFLRARGILVLHEENPNWRLQAIVVKDVNPQDAFLMNIEENRRRRSTNPIDDSYNISRLMNDFGWDSKRVAVFYGWSSSQVSIVRRLKGLDERLQRKVAKGVLSPAEAVKLLKLEPEKIQEVVEAIPEVDEPEPVDFDPETIPFDDSTPNQSLQPEVKPKKTREEQEEENKKTNKRYQNSKKAAKKAGKAAVKKVTKASGAKTSRSLAELNSAIKGREDRASKAILNFLSEDWNELELNTELDAIEEALTSV